MNESCGVPRWANVGRSDTLDSRAAGAESCRAAVGDRPEPKLLITFASERHDLAALLAGIADAAPGVPLVGCSTAGEIATGGPGDAGAVVFALGGSGFSVATRASTGAAADLRGAGADAAACMADIDGAPHRVMVLLTDALAGDQTEILRGVYGVVGAAVPLVGGCAGDDLKMKRTYQLHGGEVLTDSVVAAAISSDAPFGIGVRHGWRVLGDPMLVTRSDGNLVHEIDDRPALDVYLERLDAPPEACESAEAFTRYALTHPLGLARRTGEAHVRFVGEADFSTRSLVCIAAVPEGGSVWFMEGDDESVLDATDAACDDALAALDGRPPIGVLAFDCIARRGVLGDAGIAREIDRISDHAGGAAVAGFYTYGEIARTQGVNGFHNETLVVLAVS